MRIFNAKELGELFLYALYREEVLELKPILTYDNP